MKKLIEVSYDKIVDRWGIDNKGKGVITCVAPLDYIAVIVNVLRRMSSNNKKLKLFIVVNNVTERTKVVQAIKDANIQYKTFVCITFDYVKLNWSYSYDLAIVYGRNEWDEYVNNVLRGSKFKLMFLNKINIPVEELAKIYKHLSAVNTINATDVRNLIEITPVKEEYVPVDFPNESIREAYDKASAYISDTLQIFGNFENIDYARTGRNDTSAMNYVYSIAQDNGWDSELDMSIPFNVEIDNTYNPNILTERAHNCYNIIRERNNLVSDNDSKLDKLVELFIDNGLINSKVVICSKRGEFAYKISEYLDEHLLKDCGMFCGNYHDAIPNMKLIDSYGNPVCYKTGQKKGMIKIVGHKYMSGEYLRRFKSTHINTCNVISIKNTSSPEFNCEIDAIIFTSPTMTFSEFKQRFPDVTPKGNEIKIFTLYTQNTTEEKEINKIRNTFK